LVTVGSGKEEESVKEMLEAVEDSRYASSALAHK
jgi:hypothetical protein